MIETCATHGLKYDPAITGGCVLCRRALRAEPVPKRFDWWQPIALLGVVLGAVGIVVAPRFIHREHPVFLRVGAGFAQDRYPCVEACAHSEEKGQAKCSPRDMLCGSDALALLDACLWRCTEKSVLEPGDASELFSLGNPPSPEALERAILEAVTAGAAACDIAEPRMLYARVAVRAAGGKPSSVVVNTALQNEMECSRTALTGRDFPRAAGDYVLVARATARPKPPAAAPVAPEQPQQPQQPQLGDAINAAMVAQPPPTPPNNP